MLHSVMLVVLSFILLSIVINYQPSTANPLGVNDTKNSIGDSVEVGNISNIDIITTAGSTLLPFVIELDLNVAETKQPAEKQYDNAHSVGHENDVGYLKKTDEKGGDGYQHFESFHNKDGDSYGYEKHEAFGKSDNDKSSGNKQRAHTNNDSGSYNNGGSNGGKYSDHGNKKTGGDYTSIKKENSHGSENNDDDDDEHSSYQYSHADKSGHNNDGHHGGDDGNKANNDDYNSHYTYKNDDGPKDDNAHSSYSYSYNSKDDDNEKKYPKENYSHSNTYSKKFKNGIEVKGDDVNVTSGEGDDDDKSSYSSNSRYTSKPDNDHDDSKRQRKLTYPSPWPAGNRYTTASKLILKDIDNTKQNLVQIPNPHDDGDEFSYSNSKFHKNEDVNDNIDESGKDVNEDYDNDGHGPVKIESESYENDDSSNVSDDHNNDNNVDNINSGELIVDSDNDKTTHNMNKRDKYTHVRHYSTDNKNNNDKHPQKLVSNIKHGNGKSLDTILQINYNNNKPKNVQNIINYINDENDDESEERTHENYNNNNGDDDDNDDDDINDDDVDNDNSSEEDNQSKGKIPDKVKRVKNVLNAYKYSGYTNHGADGGGHGSIDSGHNDHKSDDNGSGHATSVKTNGYETHVVHVVPKESINHNAGDGGGHAKLIAKKHQRTYEVEESPEGESRQHASYSYKNSHVNKNTRNTPK